MPGDEDRIAYAREVYGGLLDPGLTTYQNSLRVDPDEERAPVVAQLLESLFRADPGCRGVALLLKGQPEDTALIGISGRTRLWRAQETAAPPAPAPAPELGAGDRAGLLGVSTQYRALQFVCRVCGARKATAYYDVRELPGCPNGHGVMELVR
ncbi:hypothetical protein [Streptomyces sp. NPDC002671]